MGKAEEAAFLVTKYLNVNSNDCRAWDILFSARCYGESYDKALIAGTNALAFGCEKNVTTIGMVLLEARRFDLVDKLITPRLLALKSSEDRESKREALNLLVLYGLFITNKQLYISALEGVHARDLGNNQDLRDNIKRGCQIFNTKETEQLCKELKVPQKAEKN